MVFATPPFSRLEASASACELFLHSAVRPLNDRAGAQAMKAAIAPFFALDFTRELVSLVVGKRLNDFCARLRSSSLSRTHYAAFALHIKLAVGGNAVDFALEWEGWRYILVSRNLTEQLSLPDWIPIINLLASHSTTLPTDLIDWSFADISVLSSLPPEHSLVLALFRVSLIALKALSSPVPASSWKLASSAHSLARALRVPSVGQAEFAIYHADALGDLELGDGFLRLGPAAKIRKLAASDAPHRSILRFLNTGAQINVMRQVQDSLKSVASGIQ